MVAGVDSIDDLALLRHGGMGRLFSRVYAPSTLRFSRPLGPCGRWVDPAAQWRLVFLLCPRWLTQAAVIPRSSGLIPLSDVCLSINTRRPFSDQASARKLT